MQLGKCSDTQLFLISVTSFTSSIVDGMQLFKDIYAPDKDPIPLCMEQFPKDITLGQAIETWKYIVHYQNRVEPHPLI